MGGLFWTKEGIRYVRRVVSIANACFRQSAMVCRTNVRGKASSHHQSSDISENLLAIGKNKADLWVVRAKDSLSTVMELLQGIEHHVDQEQEAAENLPCDSLYPLNRVSTRREKRAPRELCWEVVAICCLNL
jgi:hypothetical protein